MGDCKAVVFDMDGVLLDSESVCDRTWCMAFEELKLPVDKDIIDECRGCNNADMIQKLKARFGSDFNAERFLERTVELFYEIENREGIPLMPFVQEALEYLSRKYILCVASSTPMEAVSRQLTNAGIVKYFKTLTTGDMVMHSKPDPQIYQMACESIGIPPQECIAIEDSYNGIRSAVAANLRAVMIPDKLPPTEEMRKICWKICPSLKELMLDI